MAASNTEVATSEVEEVFSVLPFVRAAAIVRDTNSKNPTGSSPSSPQMFLDVSEELLALVASAARYAWDASSLSTAHGVGTECWLGTTYGTGQVSEYYGSALRDQRRSLNPRAFSLACLNAGASHVCGELGLTGASVTLVGQRAGLDALACAYRSLEMGVAERVVCGAFDWLSPLAVRLLRAQGIVTTSTEGTALVLVIERPKCRTNDEEVAVRRTLRAGRRHIREWSEPVPGHLSPVVEQLLSFSTRHHGSSQRSIGGTGAIETALEVGTSG